MNPVKDEPVKFVPCKFGAIREIPVDETENEELSDNEELQLEINRLSDALALRDKHIHDLTGLLKDHEKYAAGLLATATETLHNAITMIATRSTHNSRNEYALDAINVLMSLQNTINWRVSQITGKNVPFDDIPF